MNTTAATGTRTMNRDARDKSANPRFGGMPLGFEAGDANLYRYVNNEPTENSDPSGLSRMEVQDLADGRQALYYVHTNWATRNITYATGIGFLTTRYLYGGNFDDSPVFIGYYDPLTGNVQRGSNFVGVERVRREAESSFGGRPDWNAFFRDNAIDFAARANMQGVAGREALGINLDNRAVRARGEALEVGIQGAMLAVSALGALRMASPMRLASTGRTVVAEAMTGRASFQVATGLRATGLRGATHAQYVQAFRGTGFTPSGHFITRASEVRTLDLGVRTFEDLQRIIRRGAQVDAGDGVIAYVLDGMAILVNPETGVLINIRPW